MKTTNTYPYTQVQTEEVEFFIPPRVKAFKLSHDVHTTGVASSLLEAACEALGVSLRVVGSIGFIACRSSLEEASVESLIEAISALNREELESVLFGTGVVSLEPHSVIDNEEEEESVESVSEPEAIDINTLNEEVAELRKVNDSLKDEIGAFIKSDIHYFLSEK